MDLWTSDNPIDWQNALESYEAVIRQQKSGRLPERDRWYHHDFPALLHARTPAFVRLEELVLLTEWKMARGVWRARNLQLVKGNSPEEVEARSAEALASIPDPKKPIRILTMLAGIGPATASAVTAAYAPVSYPFFDELVAAQIPNLGKVAFTSGYYHRYAEAIRERAAGLAMTPVEVERALWAFSGGKGSP